MYTDYNNIGAHKQILMTDNSWLILLGHTFTVEIV